MSLLTNWEPCSLTNREAYRKFGYLSPGRMEYLIELAERFDPEAMDPAVLGDAAGQYPDEDFLQEAIDELTRVAKAIDSERLNDLVTQLEEIQDEQVRATEYGREVIRGYQEAVGRVTE